VATVGAHAGDPAGELLPVPAPHLRHRQAAVGQAG
jgi:hypothetical protein